MARRKVQSKAYIQWVESLNEGENNPCYRCRKKGEDRSGDNFHYYDKDGGGYCFKCGFTIPSAEYKEENEDWDLDPDSEVWEFEVKSKDFGLDKFKKLQSACTNNPNGYRGLTERACKVYNVIHEYSEETGELVRQFYPQTKDYQYSGVKYREIPKTFYSKGTVSTDCELFGQWRFRNSNSKVVVLTAGEIDCITAYDILNRPDSRYEPTPVVSPSTGETSCRKQLQKQYEWLNSFEKIVVCFDNDAAGNIGIERIASVLPKGKLYVMKLRLKDANCYVWDSKASKHVDYRDEFINAFWKAVKYVPSGIVGSSQIMDKIIEYAKLPKIPLPPFMHKLQSLMAGGIPLGVMVSIASASGTGKSTIVDECCYYWYFNSPYKVGVLTLESDSGQYGINILSRHLQNKINLIESEVEKLNYLQSDEVIEKSNELWYDDEGNNRFFLVDERDGELDNVKELINNLIISCDCKVIIIDPIQDLLEGCTNEDQQSFYKWMKGMMKSHQVTFINIAHVRKSGRGGLANSRGADLNEEDMFGSSSLFKSSACNIMFMRDKEHEDEFERNITRMKASKIRWTGRTSPVAGEFYYDNKTHMMYDREDWEENHSQPKKF